MLNRCEFIGNLGRDPEIRTTQSGKKCANLRLAVTEKYKDRDGNRQEKTEWVSIVIWSEGLVRVAEQYLRKGSKVYLEGKLETRKWQDQSGNDRYSTEVVLRPYTSTLLMLDGKNTDHAPASPGGGNTSSGGGYGGGPVAGDRHIDDEIPFAACWWA